VHDARLLRGKAAYALGRYTEALAEFQAAAGPLTRSSPGEPTFWEAEALFRLKRWEDARARYAALVRDHPSSPHAADALYGQGLSELELGRSADAIRTLTTLVASHPGSELAASGAYALGRELVRAKQWPDAIRVLAPYATRFPKSPFVIDSLYLLGVAQVEAGRPAEGVKTLERFVAESPRGPLTAAARVRLAETYEKTGQESQALEQYQALINAPPDPEFVPHGLSRVVELALRLGRPAEAEAAWRTLRRDHREHALTRAAGLALARHFQKRGDHARAVDLARDVVLAGGAERVEALAVLADSAFAAGKIGEAERAYAQALPGMAPTGEERRQALENLVALGQRAARAGRAADAERVLVLALGTAPAGSAGQRQAAGELLLLGDDLLKAKKRPEAQRVFKAAREGVPPRSPEYYRALGGLGFVAELDRQLETAKRLYREIAAGASDRDLAGWARKRVESLEAEEKPAAPATPKHKTRPSPATKSPDPRS
jgi:TolA-binding protein